MNSVASQRILRGASALLDATLLDQNGEAADAAGAVTVQVDRADGANLIAAGSATTNPAGTGTYQRALTAAQTALLDVLTAVWTDAGDTSTFTTLHEIVGRFYFSIADLRAFDATITAAKYPDANVLVIRREVEEELERITHCAFVPRYHRVRLDGSGTSSLVLPDWAPRTVRSVRAYSDATTYTAYTAAELAALDLAEWGVLTRTDGSVFAAGTRNMLVEYEHGYDQPPSDLAHAVKQRARFRLNMEKSGVTETAQRIQHPDGTVYEFDGLDDIEQRQVFRTYMGYSKRTPGVA